MAFGQKPNIYLVFTDRSFRYLVFDQKNNQLIEKNEIVFDTPILEDGKLVNESTLRSALSNLVKNKKWKNSKLFFIVPDQFVTMKKEEIPAQLSYKEAKEYIKLQLNSTIRLPFKNPVFDFEPLEVEDQHQKILLFAYPKQHLTKLQNLFEEVDLHPEFADISFLSVYRAYNQLNQIKRENQDEQHLLMIQWHKFDIALTVFHNGQPEFNRHTHLSGTNKSWKKNEETNKWQWIQTQEELDRIVEEQLLAIERFMDFYKYSVTDGEAEITDILVKGGFPKLDYVRNWIKEQFNISVQTIELPFGLEDEYSALYGLTLKEEAMLKKQARIKAEKKANKKSARLMKKETKKQVKQQKKVLRDEDIELTKMDRFLHAANENKRTIIWGVGAFLILFVLLGILLGGYTQLQDFLNPLDTNPLIEQLPEEDTEAIEVEEDVEEEDAADDGDADEENQEIEEESIEELDEEVEEIENEDTEIDLEDTEDIDETEEEEE